MLGWVQTMVTMLWQSTIKSCYINFLKMNINTEIIVVVFQASDTIWLEMMSSDACFVRIESCNAGVPLDISPDKLHISHVFLHL